MTRKSRREIETDLEQFGESTAETDVLDLSGGWEFINADDETPNRDPDLVTADGFEFYHPNRGDT